MSRPGPWLSWQGMNPAEYQALIERWQQNRLAWNASDIKRLQEKVRRITKREKDGPIR